MATTVAAAAGSSDGSAGGVLTWSAADAAFDAAVAHWSSVDAAAAAQLSNVTVQLANLPGDVLGLVSESTGRVWLDRNGAGHGGALSQEARDKGREPRNSDSRPGHSTLRSPLSMDLPSVVTHELGHVLGLPDLDADLHPHDLMSGRLGAGVRRLPMIGESSISAAPVSPTAGSTADRLFADLGGRFGDVRRDPFSEVSQLKGSPVKIQRPADDDWRLAARRVLDDEEDLFVEVGERQDVGRDEESADELFSELFTELD